MINIYGNTQGRERQAAEQIVKLMCEWNPHLRHSEEDDIKLFAGFKNWQATRKDIDIVLVANFKEKLKFNPEFNFKDKDTKKFFRPRQCFVKSLACAIEVKDVSNQGIIFSGTNVSVNRSDNKKEDVTDQNYTQAIELAQLFKRKYLNNESSVYVSAVIYLTALYEKDLPPRPHNIFAGDAKFSRILNTIAASSNSLSFNNILNLQSTSNSEDIKKILDEKNPDTDWMIRIPTGLDRKRMDQISNQNFDKADLKKNKLSYKEEAV